MSFDREGDLLTRDEHVINFIKSFVALEEEIPLVEILGPRLRLLT